MGYKRISEIENVDDISSLVEGNSYLVLDGSTSTADPVTYTTYKASIAQLKTLFGTEIEIDNTVTEGSTNPVSSSGIYNFVNEQQITVDNKMKDTSTNPVQNKIVKRYIDDFVDYFEDYYTKTEIDNMIGNISTLLDTINGEVI